MLTIFSIPKPFVGHIGLIQRNAIQSWRMLRPACEIILFGDETGIPEIAAEFGLRHIAAVARTPQGTPLVNDLFAQAQHAAAYDLLCYVNADIMLMDDLLRATDQVVHHTDRFLMVGQRWELDLQQPIEFSDDWQNRLRNEITAHGNLHGIGGIDYFLFTRGLFQSIPPFAIGRTAWDGWLIQHALSQQAMVVDATSVVSILHQNHDYVHLHGGKYEAFQGAEAQENRRLAGIRKMFFTVHDATHKLTAQGVESVWDDDVYLKQRFMRRIENDLSPGIPAKFRRFYFKMLRKFFERMPQKIWRKLAYRWLR